MKEQRRSVVILSIILLILSGLCISIAIVFFQQSQIIDGGSGGNNSSTDSSSLQRSSLSSSLYGGISYDVAKSVGYLDGYNLFNLHAINASNRGKRINNSLVIFDMDGNLILENPVVTKPVEMINSTTILGNSANGAVLWNMETEEYQFLDVRGHHEFEYNPNSNTVFTLELTIQEIEGNDYRFDKILEYALNGSLVWELDIHDFIDHTQWCPYQDHKENYNDVTHSNSVFYNADEDSILLNVRNVNTFYKIDHATGEIIWALGEYGDFTLVDRFGRERTNLFYHAHSVEQIDETRFIVFDNDLHNQTDEYSYQSRILEIEIDRETMTAREAWTWTGDRSYFSGFWGDADRLANGNRLGVFGADTRYDCPYGARLVEVNDIGDIVWEMSFRNTDDFIYGVYRMERIRFSPILSSEADVLISYGTNLSLSWQAWYNFRPKRTMHGTYDLYIDGFLSETGPVHYDRFWRPVNMSLQVGVLDVGDHNITLTIKDEAGHKTSDTVKVRVRTFHMDRTGPLISETGAANSTIFWSGVTSYPVSFELSVDSGVLEQSPWNGSDLYLDLNRLAIGQHHIVLEFENSSGTIYTDSFMVTMNPSAMPEFISVPDETTIDWNSTTTMSWSVFDHSPSEWHLYLNGEVQEFGAWDGGNHYMEWTISDIDEGTYNVTMVLQDIVSNRVFSTTWLNVIPPSPPVLTEEPQSDIIEWAKQTEQYSWEIHGGDHWSIYRNGTIIMESLKQDPTITLEIEDWQADGWRLGHYNITLLVSDDSHTVSSTIWLTVYVDFGDAYVDSVVVDSSSWYSDGENVIGAPDTRFASLFQDYGPGRMTLDMGENEEILNDIGIDFEVISYGGNYSVSVSPSLSQPFRELGVVSDTHGFDLSSVEYDIVRYVRLEMRSSETVHIDSIVSMNYNEQGTDDESPWITNLGNIEIWTNQTPFELEWHVNDLTPWNYSIYINGVLDTQGPWNGDSLVYSFSQLPGNWTVMLLVYDLFGNHASSTLNVSVKMTLFDTLLIITLPSSVSIIGIGVVYLWRNKRDLASSEM